MPRNAYLALLNRYFDCMAGAVIENGGEVVKYIGDRLMAIFPIEDPQNPDPQVAFDALAAVRDAHARIDAVNAERQPLGEPAISFGIGLHRGDVTYGNVGTDRRLDFTVISSAVNEASRIEEICKPLKTTIVISEDLAKSLPGELISLGRHELHASRSRRSCLRWPPRWHCISLRASSPIAAKRHSKP